MDELASDEAKTGEASRVSTPQQSSPLSRSSSEVPPSSVFCAVEKSRSASAKRAGMKGSKQNSSTHFLLPRCMSRSQINAMRGSSFSSVEKRRSAARSRSRCFALPQTELVGGTDRHLQMIGTYPIMRVHGTAFENTFLTYAFQGNRRFASPLSSTKHAKISSSNSRTTVTPSLSLHARQGRGGAVNGGMHSVSLVASAQSPQKHLLRHGSVVERATTGKAMLTNSSDNNTNNTTTESLNSKDNSARHNASVNSNTVRSAAVIKRVMMWRIIIVTVLVHTHWVVCFREARLLAVLRRYWAPLLRHKRALVGEGEKMHILPRRLYPEKELTESEKNGSCAVEEMQEQYLKKHCSFLSAIDHTEFFRALGERMTRERYLPGELIAGSDEPSEHALFFIISGKCVYHRTRSLYEHSSKDGHGNTSDGMSDVDAAYVVPESATMQSDNSNINQGNKCRGISGQRLRASGAAATSNAVPRSRRRILHSGSTFGGVFRAHCTFGGDITALTQCIVWRLTAVDFERVLKQYADESMLTIYVNAMRSFQLDRIRSRFPIAAVMSRVPIYRRLRRAVELYAGDFEPVVKVRGEVLFNQGDAAGDVYCLLEGSVTRLVKKSTYPEEKSLARSTTNDSITNNCTDCNETDDASSRYDTDSAEVLTRNDFGALSIQARCILLGDSAHIISGTSSYRCVVHSRTALFYRISGEAFVNALLDDPILYLSLREQLAAQMQSSMRLHPSCMERVGLFYGWPESARRALAAAAEPRVLFRSTTLCEPMQTVQEIFVVTEGRVRDERHPERSPTPPRCDSVAGADCAALATAEQKVSTPTKTTAEMKHAAERAGPVSAAPVAENTAVAGRNDLNDSRSSGTTAAAATTRKKSKTMNKSCAPMMSSMSARSESTAQLRQHACGNRRKAGNVDGGEDKEDEANGMRSNRNNNNRVPKKNILNSIADGHTGVERRSTYSDNNNAGGGYAVKNNNVSSHCETNMAPLSKRFATHQSTVYESSNTRKHEMARDADNTSRAMDGADAESASFLRKLALLDASTSEIMHTMQHQRPEQKQQQQQQQQSSALLGSTSQACRHRFFSSHHHHHRRNSESDTFHVPRRRTSNSSARDDLSNTVDGANKSIDHRRRSNRVAILSQSILSRNSSGSQSVSPGRQSVAYVGANTTTSPSSDVSVCSNDSKCSMQTRRAGPRAQRKATMVVVPATMSTAEAAPQPQAAHSSSSFSRELQSNDAALFTMVQTCGQEFSNVTAAGTARRGSRHTIASNDGSNGNGNQRVKMICSTSRTQSYAKQKSNKSNVSYDCNNDYSNGANTDSKKSAKCDTMCDSQRFATGSQGGRYVPVNEESEISPALQPRASTTFLFTLGGSWVGLLADRWPQGWESTTATQVWAIPVHAIRTQFHSLSRALQNATLYAARIAQRDALGWSDIVVAKLPEIQSASTAVMATATASNSPAASASAEEKGGSAKKNNKNITGNQVSEKSVRRTGRSRGASGSARSNRCTADGSHSASPLSTFTAASTHVPVAHVMHPHAGASSSSSASTTLTAAGDGGINASSQAAIASASALSLTRAECPAQGLPMPCVTAATISTLSTSVGNNKDCTGTKPKAIKDNSFSGDCARVARESALSHDDNNNDKAYEVSCAQRDDGQQRNVATAAWRLESSAQAAHTATRGATKDAASSSIRSGAHRRRHDPALYRSRQGVMHSSRRGVDEQSARRLQTEGSVKQAADTCNREPAATRILLHKAMACYLSEPSPGSVLGGDEVDYSGLASTNGRVLATSAVVDLGPSISVVHAMSGIEHGPVDMDAPLRERRRKMGASSSAQHRYVLSPQRPTASIAIRDSNDGNNGADWPVTASRADQRWFCHVPLYEPLPGILSNRHVATRTAPVMYVQSAASLASANHVEHGDVLSEQAQYYAGTTAAAATPRGAATACPVLPKRFVAMK